MIKNKKILPKIFQKRFLKVLPCTIYKQISLLKFCQNFDVTEDGAIIESTLINEEIVEVPSTGLSSINYEVVGSLILIVSGLGLIGYVLFKKKRK